MVEEEEVNGDKVDELEGNIDDDGDVEDHGGSDFEEEEEEEEEKEEGSSDAEAGGHFDEAHEGIQTVTFFVFNFPENSSACSSFSFCCLFFFCSFASVSKAFSFKTACYD
ncbi:hypothetical protein PoB_002287300 [Plakobranchus ocellatus]|uniref:Uncharacterized protein n=1 Tax=Plakobranchus ocellatus TaxID=259542 RepID=A0AAV3ZPG8_9GAST|nr:hypothetical protein PoB_002287300 [Plakobranchus ocellatus]